MPGVAIREATGARDLPDITEPAGTPGGLRLRHRRLNGSTAPLRLSNTGDDFILVLPLRRGHVLLEDEARTIFDGEVGPGTVRFVQPGESASVTVRSDFDEALLCIPGTTFREHAVRHGLRTKGSTCPQMRRLLPSSDPVRRLLPLLDMAVGMEANRRQALVDGLATTMMALMLDRDLHSAPASASGFDAAEFALIADFADRRLARGLELGAWARSAGLSIDEFSHRFVRHTGVAPYAWFMDRRIELAKRLLLESGLPLAELALEAGFCSQSHFTEAFRRRAGEAPGRWRRARLRAMAGDGAGRP